MNFHVTKNDNGEAVDFFIRVTSPVARQKHGWHEYEIDGPTVADYCSLCGWQKKLHLSRVDYVTHRLRHGRFTKSEVRRIMTPWHYLTNSPWGSCIWESIEMA